MASLSKESLSRVSKLVNNILSDSDFEFGQISFVIQNKKVYEVQPSQRIRVKV